MSVLMIQLFDACFLIRIYRYTCAYLYMPLGTHLATRWRVSDSPRPACSDTEAWIEVEPSAEDQAYLSEQTAWSQLLLFLTLSTSSWDSLSAREHLLHCTYCKSYFCT